MGIIFKKQKFSLRVLLSIGLFFCQFPSSVAYKNVAYKKSVHCTTSFIETWTKVLHKFKFCSRRVGDSRCWGSLTMVPRENEAKRLSSVNQPQKQLTIKNNLSLHKVGIILVYVIGICYQYCTGVFLKKYP